MKKIPMLGLCCLLCFSSFNSCKEKPEDIVIGRDYFSHFKIINNSGVQVAVVDKHPYFPDSLVLPNGKEYIWDMTARWMKWPIDGRYNPKIYFDEDILVVYGDDYLPDRNPGHGSNYDRVAIDTYNESRTFTFTPEDYQNALKQKK